MRWVQDMLLVMGIWGFHLLSHVHSSLQARKLNGPAIKLKNVGLHV